MVTNQIECSRFEQRSVIKVRSANYVKFIEEYVMFIEKYVLVKTMFTNGLNMGLSL